MDESTLIDELRALLAGSLPSEEAKRIRERCAADPELRALLDELAEVHALTAPAAEETPPPCRLTFEEVEGALVPQRVRRMALRWPWRVAAAVLVFVVGGFVLSRAISDRAERSGGDVAVAPPSGTDSDRPNGGEAGRSALVLAAIPLDPAPASESGPEVPASLADFRPVKNEQIQWIDSFAEATAIARVTSRPVLLFLHIDTCPWCIEMREGALADPEVVARIESFVPAAVNYMRAGDDMKKLTKDGWPWFGAVDADGGVILSFPGRQGAGDFREHMLEAAKLAGPPVISWETANGGAGLLVRGRRLEDLRKYGDAWWTYERVRMNEYGALFDNSAAAGVKRIAAAAREALLGAASLARTGVRPETVLPALEEAIRQFAASPYAADLQKVKDHLEKHGEFPKIQGLD